MIRKFTLFNKYTLIVELLFFGACGWLITTSHYSAGVVIIFIYIITYIFSNSVITNNYESSILKTLNLLKAPVKPQLFFMNSLLYFPALILLALSGIRDAFLLVMFGLICIYQLTDGLLLRIKQKLYVFCATFSIFTILGFLLFFYVQGEGL